MLLNHMKVSRGVTGSRSRNDYDRRLPPARRWLEFRRKTSEIVCPVASTFLDRHLIELIQHQYTIGAVFSVTKARTRDHQLMCSFRGESSVSWLPNLSLNFVGGPHCFSGSGTRDAPIQGRKMYEKDFRLSFSKDTDLCQLPFT